MAWNADARTLAEDFARIPDHGLVIQSLGQCGYLWKWDGRRVGVDVVLSDLYYPGTTQSRRLIGPPCPPGAFPVLDLYLVSHDHADHHDHAYLEGVLADRSVGLIAPESILRRYGRTYERERRPWITPVPVAHETYRYDAEGNPLAYGFFVDTPYGVLFHGGDCVETEELVAALTGYGKRIRFLFLPINGRGRKGIVGNMDAGEAIDVAVRTQATYLIPTHWDLFRENGADIEDFIRRADRAGIRYLIQHPGQSWWFAQERQEGV